MRTLSDRRGFTYRPTFKAADGAKATETAPYTLLVSWVHDDLFNNGVIAYAVSVKAGYRTRLAATKSKTWVGRGSRQLSNA